MRTQHLIVTCILYVMLSTSCGDILQLDLQDNPNEAKLDKAGPDFVYNNIQLSAIKTFQDLHFIADGLVRYTSLGNFTYNEALPSTTGNSAWNEAYANLFPDVLAMNKAYGDNPQLEIYIHTANILQAYVMMGLVDYFGDIPWSDALQGINVISPGVDPGADVYAAAEKLLDEAIIALENTNAISPANDLYYGGDMSKWVTCAKTLKLRIGIATRLVGGASKIMEIVNGGDFIDDPSEDFQFAYGTERSDPDSRHPFYPDQYESRDGTYMGNYFMWLMCCEKDTVSDPRIRHYFYRQVHNTLNLDINLYACVYTESPVSENKPPWYLAVDPNMPYCVASGHFYGRDHGNGSGIPPDGFVRTLYGLYPGGGKWDNETYGSVQNRGIDGSLGEGIAPLITSFQVAFYRAEAALTAGTGEDARKLLEEGVRGSINKVRSFESRIPRADLELIIDEINSEFPVIWLLPNDAQIEKYVSTVLNRYDQAESNAGRLDVVMKEFYIASAGNAYEVYNFYRRTGMPLNIQPGLDQSIGSFPRSIRYASDNVNLNGNIEQKELTKLVFWDDGSAVLR